MKYIYRGTDLILSMQFTDADGVECQLTDYEEFKIQLYTTDKTDYIEGSFTNASGLTNLVITGTTTLFIVNSDSLDGLEDGLIKYITYIKNSDSNFQDGNYDEVKYIQSSYFLKTI